jgi:hypothetical protein
MTKEQIKNGLDLIENLLDTEAKTISEWENKLSQLTSICGFSATVLAHAHATKEMELKEKILLMCNIKPPLQPSLISKISDGLVPNETMLYKRAERMNAAISHCIDGLRSLISLHKQEMQNSIYNNT